MKRFSIPADFRPATLDKYSQMNEEHEYSKIFETYGQLNHNTPLGSCKVNTLIPKIDEYDLEEYVKYSKEKGIEFNYVLDTVCTANEELTPRGYKKLKEFLRRIADMGVDSITISLPSVMEMSRYVVPDLKIVASAACRVDSPRKAAFYENIGVYRAVIDEDIYRDFVLLKNIRKTSSIEMEAVINSFCINDCPYKIFNCNTSSYFDDEAYPYYLKRCIEQHEDAEALIRMNFIRPEDISRYSDAGINYFRLQGIRDISSGDLLRTVSYYMQEKYDGDLMVLLELFSSEKPLSVMTVKINNSELDGFIDGFSDEKSVCNKLCHECGYCRQYSEKAIKKSDRVFLEFMKIADETQREQFLKIFEK